MVSALFREDPALGDSIVQWGAESLTRAVPGKQRRYYSIAGVAKSTGNRHLNGDKHSPATKWFIRIATAANGWPLIAQAISMVIMLTIRKARIEDLHNRLNELNDLEHDAECDENRQTMRAAVNATPEQLEVAAKADIREAELSLERSAILRELARRLRKA